MPTYTLTDLLSAADTPPDFLCDPYILRRGITYLHGKTSIGKSPLTWELARCIAQGLPFLGHPTTAGTVLYLEADTAPTLMSPRLRLLPEPRGNWTFDFLLGASMDLANEGHSIHHHLAALHHQLHPDFVIWNTLRQFYKGSAIDSDTVTRVYNAMYRAFPVAGHLVVAHDRKGSTHPDATHHEDEDFAGSAAWRDLATTALHLVRRTTKGGTLLSLEHTKSQVSEQADPLRYTLDPDGTRLHPVGHPLYPALKALMDDLGQCQATAEVVTLAQKELNISRKTVFRILASVKPPSVSSL